MQNDKKALKELETLKVSHVIKMDIMEYFIQSCQVHFTMQVAIVTSYCALVNKASAPFGLILLYLPKTAMLHNQFKSM